MSSTAVGIKWLQKILVGNDMIWVESCFYVHTRDKKVSKHSIVITYIRDLYVYSSCPSSY
jgi:hypothetical protein